MMKDVIYDRISEKSIFGITFEAYFYMNVSRERKKTIIIIYEDNKI